MLEFPKKKKRKKHRKNKKTTLLNVKVNYFLKLKFFRVGFWLIF